MPLSYSLFTPDGTTAPIFRLTVEENREVCLDPDSEQGQRLQHCWKSVQSTLHHAQQQNLRSVQLAAPPRVAWTGGDIIGVEPDGVIDYGEAGMPGWRPRCECVQTAEWVKPVRRITKIAVQEPSWYCSRTEIILTVEGNREVCLDPDSEQGQKLQHCWKSHDMNVAKTKTCLRSKKMIH
ncbi:hypothetical protein COCON_G00226770 [Conger conger]|uniref:Chemokine interleukin-8-like domain-containing protein n=1 Tax=Conger conger TaxID=82655 RepID=A0A9Q1HLP4_CONCO|nr:hypothetical protein COCON_G00226770 [Conger conger]